ncbi:hypothetical protein VTN77DRAFT_2034 [Rasamsonia byssochlamydoides]|uniref:uncharacterized protein n=1 Tax=Rasamsonia byssochlamydoides TaxID=89139 RepID=UPI0037437F1A
MTTTFFENKVYAITGVAGIGLAVAKQLRERGAKLSLADIDPKALADAAAQLGNDDANVLTTKVDVGNAAEVNAWIDATVQKFGRLDGAANMAGAIGKHHGVRALVDQDDDEWDLIMRVNVTGLKNCLRAQLKAITAGTGTGSIVNASSIQGLQGFARHAAYSASKHAVTGLTRSVAKEVAPAIRVNAIAPGTIQTPLLDKAIEIQGGKLDLPCAFPRFGTADEVAHAVVYLLSDASSYTTGTILSVDGGWNC